MKLNKIHHVAVICSDYEQSKQFYKEVLGLKIVSEHYREERQSWKADCWMGDTYVVELFSFPNPPALLPIPKQPACATWLSRWTISRLLSASSTARA